MMWGVIVVYSSLGRDGDYGVTVALQLVELAVPGQVRIVAPKGI